MTQHFKHLRANKDRLSARQYNKLVDMVGNDRDSLRRFGRSDSTGHISRPAPPSAVAERMLYRARATEAAGATDHITCNLIETDGTEVDSGEFGFEIEVYFDISGGSALNEALPRLADDEYIHCYQSYNISGDLQWYGIPPWQASIDCECDSADLIATAAPDAASGAMWFDTATKELKIYDGAAWKAVELGGHDIATVAGGLLSIAAQEITLDSAVLIDLDTLGANAADSEFLVGTGAGALAWENAATAATSMGLGTANLVEFAKATVDNLILDAQTLQATTGDLLLVSVDDDITLTAFDDVWIEAGDEIEFFPGGDGDNYLELTTVGNQTTIRFVNQNGEIKADNGTVSFDNENITTTGTLTATTIGAFQATGAIDFNNQNATNVDIDSGDIEDAVTCTKWDDHIGASGASHTYIDQAVTVAGTPQFALMGLGTAAQSHIILDMAKTLTAQTTYGLNMSYINDYFAAIPGHIISAVYGLNFAATITPASQTSLIVASNLGGINATAQLISEAASSGDLQATNAFGVKTTIASIVGAGASGTTTIVTATGFWCNNFTEGNGGVITTARAFYDAGQTAGATNWGLAINTQSYINAHTRLNGNTAPTDPLSITLATEALDIVDAGSTAATEQDWIEVKVGGNTGYIRVFAAK